MTRGLRRAAVLVPCLAACSPSGSSSTPSPASRPVAVVGDRTISQSQLDLRLRTAENVIGQSGGDAASRAHRDAMVRELRARVMQSLILDAVIAEEAAYRHVEADDRAIDAEIAADAAAAGGMEALRTQLAESGGSLEQRRDEVRASLDERRLEDLFARQRADEAESALAAGAALSDVASEYSDDNRSGGAPGAPITLTDEQLKAGDAGFASAVQSLSPGQLLPHPVRDSAGYEIVRLDSRTSDSWTFHRILVAAPQPYTVRDRPRWFAESVFAAVQEDCARGRIRLLIQDAGPSPCQPPPAGSTAPSPAGSTAPSPAGSTAPVTPAGGG